MDTFALTSITGVIIHFTIAVTKIITGIFNAYR
jgi:hypothetical protein